MHSGDRQRVQADGGSPSLQNGYGTSAGFAGRSSLRPLQGRLPVYGKAPDRKPPLIQGEISLMNFLKPLILVKFN